jgi:hypothetical protein
MRNNFLRAPLAGRAAIAALLMTGLFATELLATGASAADDVKPSWTCLPEQTVLVVRVPGAMPFIEALRRETKLGSVMLNPQRLERIKQIAQNDEDDWEKMVKELAKYHLRVEDLQHLFAGEVGMGIVAQAREGNPPVLMNLYWAEPSEDLASRVFEALDQIIDEQKEDPFPIRRTDVELAGHKVVQLVIPQTSAEDIDAEMPPLDRTKSTPEERKAWREQRIKRLEEAKKVEVDQVHVFLARIGNRLLMAHTWSGLAAPTEKAEGAPPVDLSAATGREEATGIFARFLAEHANSDGGSTVRLLATPGLSTALPGGLPLVEVIGDPRPAMKLLNTEKNAQVNRVLQALALDKLGPLAYRISLDKNMLRSGLFVSAPAPRTGILALLDQKPLGGEPPDWAPTQLVSFMQFSFELGAAYTAIKKICTDEFGDTLASTFSLIELQTNTYFDTDAATLLSSLGHEHSILTLPPQKARKAAAAEKADDDEAADEASGRMALVWQVKDEALWKKIIPTVAGLTGSSVIEEQGFTGVRFDQAGYEGGVFLGSGHVMLGAGPDVVESVLAILRKPPSGEAALRASPLGRRAATLLPPEPSLGFQFTDLSQYVTLWRQSIDSSLATAKAHVKLGDAGADTTDALLDKFKDLVPTEAELEGVLGVGAAQTVVGDHGVTRQSISELPAP